MTTDDLWGSDSQEEEQDGLPPGFPPGAQAILIHGSPRDKERVLNQYSKLAGRPETSRYAEEVTNRVTELNELGALDVPDETMGTFGLVAQKYGFHGETVKMAAKFEVDEAIERAIPSGLLEIIQKATSLPESMTVLFEMAFAMGYSFALDGTLSKIEAEAEGG